MTSNNYPKAYLYMRIVQAKLFMDKYYAEPITLNIITGEAFFSKYHFIRTFSKIYGFTPHQYLKNVRLEKAKQLLKDRMSISDVCNSVGFQSKSSFVGLFRKSIGETPATFRKKHFERNSEMKSVPLKFIPGCFAEQIGWK